MAESVASDLAIARLIQKLGGSKRRSVIEETTSDGDDQTPESPLRQSNPDKPRQD